ncbi:hypothetical protein BKM31_50355 [[Actinomadura] parvosata subsp. kistnae]|uniref:Uncharacterized protein n=1 Tax=[Actinomadura] parvosata subsp. kistnae TaxID=1909395 RepID=A0A1V0AEG9_9ACTN|nr:hypothetical protein BKM31_50355 [Nonomuraea sp. ATCC 55076]
MLFGALLAPAILAGGLLAGEMRGFEWGVARAGGGEEGVAGVAFEPVLVPAPPRPERRYAAAMPSPVREVPRRVRRVEVEEAAPEERGKEEEPVTPAPVRTQGGCPGEWVDTWLWELCRDREQEQEGAGQEEGLVGDGWLPGV